MSIAHVTTDALRDLHQLHRRIQNLREQIARGPRQVEARRRFLAARQADLEAFRAEAKRLRMAMDQKELQLRSNETRITERRRQLNEAKTNKEYSALQHQIDADKMSNSVLEDEILETMTRADQKKAEVAQLEQELVRSQAEFTKLEAEVAERGKFFQEQLAQAETALREAETSLPPEARETYLRLSQARGADCLAAVEDESCSGCFTSISHQSKNELLMNRLVYCKSCGRLLYLAEATARPQAAEEN